ncbi:ABA 3 protein [Aspergillus costaricaensis CBS 115574]|uniref:ABA 3 protein n=1 Tax=Aspergillus costaricaensis CBS 115574 TaxID=1448317 RepID=A0ACD1IJH9_9EURO|nr:ABA 3 protein [Aspergillus costaricaensis CBS 115574]RAK90465.1 ABA 3 protein [Aspergillus costaricaensis CBS 115574]
MAIQNRWFYPKDIAHDLDGIELPTERKNEILACAWEYARSVIPQYTNWKRYVAFMRTMVISITCEFRGDLVDVAASAEVLGYDLKAVLDDLFHDTPGHTAMAQEFKCFLLVTSEKTGHHRNDSELFRRYVDALVGSPRQWFRMRDCDGLARFTIAAALACNDLLDTWYTEEYTFAYIPENERVNAFHQAREILWAVDVVMAGMSGYMATINFIRSFGGPIQTTMRRYRFVDDGLSIGKTESEEVINKARQNFKLWNRVDAGSVMSLDVRRYNLLIARCDDLMFPGLADYLEVDSQHCNQCVYRKAYGAQRAHCFGGVELCGQCRDEWGQYLKTLPERTKQAFPDLTLEI